MPARLQAFIGHLRLVAANAEMTIYLTISNFIDEGLHGSLLPGVGAEIKVFHQGEAELKTRHGETMFPYAKALKLEGHERLGLVHYPNLCKVANSHKRKLDGTFKDKSNKESLSRLTGSEVERV